MNEKQYYQKLTLTQHLPWVSHFAQCFHVRIHLILVTVLWGRGQHYPCLTRGETKEHLPKATQLVVAEPGFKLSPGWPHRCLRPVLTDRGCDQQGDSVSRWCQSSRTRDCGADTGSGYMEGMGILEPGQGEVGLFQSWGSRVYGDWEVQVTDIKGSQLRTEGLSGLRIGLPNILIRS